MIINLSNEINHDTKQYLLPLILSKSFRVLLSVLNVSRVDSLIVLKSWHLLLYLLYLLVYIDQLVKLSKIAKQNLINVIFIWKTAYELIQFINDMNNSKKNLNKKRRKYPPWTLESDWRKVISSPCPESSWICSSAISSLVIKERILIIKG